MILVNYFEKFACYIVKVIVYLLNLILSAIAGILYRNNREPRNILIFRTGSIGDTVCSIPSIVAIRNKYPKAQISILTNSGGSNLVGMKSILAPSVYDRMIDYYGMSASQLLQELRKHRFDLFIQLPQTDAGFWRLLRDLFFFRSISSAGWGWQYSTFPFFRQFQERHTTFPNETERLLAILKKNGIDGEVSGYQLRNNDSADWEIVNRAFVEANISESSFIMAIVVGAKRPQNRWPLSNFRTVMEHFQNRCTMILIGGPDDKELTSTLKGISNVIDFTGMFTPMQSAVALKKCQLTLSNDTGPMHLSYASGTPTIGLFSSRDFPGKWAPPEGNGNSWFRTPNIHCSLCLSETCSNNICMQAIHPQSVIKKIEDFIKEYNTNTQRIDS